MSDKVRQEFSAWVQRSIEQCKREIKYLEQQRVGVKLNLEAIQGYIKQETEKMQELLEVEKDF